MSLVYYLTGKYNDSSVHFTQYFKEKKLSLVSILFKNSPVFVVYVEQFFFYPYT